MNPVIEIFRGLGAWMVLNSHYAHFLFNERSFLNFLWTGVDLFFVISGFVFAPAILYKELQILPFAIRRLFRIYPLYVFSLILYYFSVNHTPGTSVYLLKHLFFLNTVFSIQDTFFFNAAYWSLPPEIEFYFSIPLLVLLRKRFSAKSILLLFPFLLCLKFVLALNAGDSVSPVNIYKILGVHLSGKAPEFFVGIFLYKAVELASRRRIHYLYPVLSLVTGVCILYALGSFFVANGDNGINKYIILKAYFALFCAIGYALVLFACLILLRGKQPGLHRYRFMGDLSYSVYLFHGLAPLVMKNMGLQLGGATAYIACSLAVFIISFGAFRFVENPSRNFGRKLAYKMANS